MTVEWHIVGAKQVSRSGDIQLMVEFTDGTHTIVDYVVVQLLEPQYPHRWEQQSGDWVPVLDTTQPKVDKTRERIAEVLDLQSRGLSDRIASMRVAQPPPVKEGLEDPPDKVADLIGERRLRVLAASDSLDDPRSTGSDGRSVSERPIGR